MDLQDHVDALLLKSKLKALEIVQEVLILERDLSYEDADRPALVTIGLQRIASLLEDLDEGFRTLVLWEPSIAEEFRLSNLKKGAGL